MMRVLVTLVLLLAVVVTSGAPAVAADLELGQKVFKSKCAGCHGADGKGNAKVAAMLKVTLPDLGVAAASKTDAELAKFVSEGKKPMPSFAKSLSKEELDAVVHYAKSLGSGPAAAK